MVQKYETRIISFEELSDRDGRQYTVYNIRVQVINEIGQQKQQQSSSPSSSSMITNSWTLRKRYKYDP